MVDQIFASSIERKEVDSVSEYMVRVFRVGCGWRKAEEMRGKEKGKGKGKEEGRGLIGCGGECQSTALVQVMSIRRLSIDCEQG